MYSSKTIERFFLSFQMMQNFVGAIICHFRPWSISMINIYTCINNYGMTLSTPLILIGLFLSSQIIIIKIEFKLESHGTIWCCTHNYTHSVNPHCRLEEYESQLRDTEENNEKMLNDSQNLLNSSLVSTSNLSSSQVPRSKCY